MLRRVVVGRASGVPNGHESSPRRDKGQHVVESSRATGHPKAAIETPCIDSGGPMEGLGWPSFEIYRGHQHRHRSPKSLRPLLPISRTKFIERKSAATTTDDSGRESGSRSPPSLQGLLERVGGWTFRRLQEKSVCCPTSTAMQSSSTPGMACERAKRTHIARRPLAATHHGRRPSRTQGSAAHLGVILAGNDVL